MSKILTRRQNKNIRRVNLQAKISTAPFYSKPAKTKEGFLITPVVIAKKCVMPYQAIDQNGNEFTRNELFDIPLNDREFIASIEGLPFCLEHPSDGQQYIDIDPSNYDELVKGVVVDVHTNEETDEIIGTLKVWNEDIIKKIESGELQEVSQGYTCVIVDEPGTYNGEKYDARQVEIVMNHLALVSEGRAGDDVRIKYKNSKRLYTVNAKSLEAIQNLINRGITMRKKLRHRYNSKDSQAEAADDQTNEENRQNMEGEKPEGEEKMSVEKMFETMMNGINKIASALSNENMEYEKDKENQGEPEKGTEEPEDKEKIKEDILNHVQNSLDVKKQVLSSMNEMSDTYNRAKSVLGADVEIEAAKHNSLNDFRKFVLEQSGFKTKDEITRMNAIETKAHFEAATDIAKTEINAPRRNAHYTGTDMRTSVFTLYN